MGNDRPLFRLRQENGYFEEKTQRNRHAGGCTKPSTNSSANISTTIPLSKKGLRYASPTFWQTAAPASQPPAMCSAYILNSSKNRYEKIASLIPHSTSSAHSAHRRESRSESRRGIRDNDLRVRQHQRNDAPVTHVFSFTNTGTTPVAIPVGKKQLRVHAARIRPQARSPRTESDCKKRHSNPKVRLEK